METRLEDLNLPAMTGEAKVELIVESNLPVKSLEERTRREEALRSNREQWDERTPLERLFDHITAARIAHYRPQELPTMRQDIICFCCGQLYRPDDPTDGENIFLCLNCIATRKGM